MEVGIASAMCPPKIELPLVARDTAKSCRAHQLSVGAIDAANLAVYPSAVLLRLALVSFLTFHIYLR